MQAAEGLAYAPWPGWQTSCWWTMRSRPQPLHQKLASFLISMAALLHARCVLNIEVTSSSSSSLHWKAFRPGIEGSQCLCGSYASYYRGQSGSLLVCF